MLYGLTVRDCDIISAPSNVVFWTISWASFVQTGSYFHGCKTVMSIFLLQRIISPSLNHAMTKIIDDDGRQTQTPPLLWRRKLVVTHSIFISKGHYSPGYMFIVIVHRNGNLLKRVQNSMLIFKIYNYTKLRTNIHIMASTISVHVCMIKRTFVHFFLDFSRLRPT